MYKQHFQDMPIQAIALRKAMDILYSISYNFFRRVQKMATRTVRVTRWGNGLGIRLPKEFTDSEGISEKSSVEISIQESSLVITPVKEPKKHIPLAKRLENWNGQPYDLTDEDKEWLNMKPAGDEVW
jgi:antitoxin component of MazEF toxin-antitoxin module